jgi:aminoglycoside phosphotransferase (APT) family kinase protein
LWASGALDRVSAVVDHTIIVIIEDDDHDVVVMRDVSRSLVPAEGAVTRATSRQLLAGLAALHQASHTEPQQDLCPIGARYQMFSPSSHARTDLPGLHPARKTILTGWQLFAERVPADVVAAVSAVHDEPTRLSAPLADLPTTLVHGDAKLLNLGIGPTGLIAIDWGDLTGFGPPEIDVAWYALMNHARLGVTPDEIFADYEEQANQPLSPQAVDLACIGSLAQMGFKLAATAVNGTTAQMRVEADASLAWWCRRVRIAIERTGMD